MRRTKSPSSCSVCSTSDSDVSMKVVSGPRKAKLRAREKIANIIQNTRRPKAHAETAASPVNQAQSTHTGSANKVASPSITNEKITDMQNAHDVSNCNATISSDKSAHVSDVTRPSPSYASQPRARLPDTTRANDTSVPRGNCLFYSLIKACKLDISALDLRKKLLDSPFIETCGNDVEAVRLLSSPTEFGNVDCAYIFASVYTKNICIHFRDDNDKYTYCRIVVASNKPFIHLHLANAHCTPYIPIAMATIESAESHKIPTREQDDTGNDMLYESPDEVRSGQHQNETSPVDQLHQQNYDRAKKKMDFSSDEDAHFTAESNARYKIYEQELEHPEEQQIPVEVVTAKFCSYSSKCSGKVFHSDAEVLSFVVDLMPYREFFASRDKQSKKILKNERRVNANSLISSCHWKFECHFGTIREPQGDGKRNCTFEKVGCPAALKFILSDDGSHYYLDSVKQHHGHDAQLKSTVEPRQKLTQEHKEFILKHFEAGGIHAKIINLLSKEYGITISSKDASNVKYAAKSKQPKSLDAVLNLLKEKNFIYEVKQSEGNVFQALFITSSSWIKMYHAWPELVFMDSTYKLIDMQYPVNIAAIVDGNGCTEVVALGILPHEDEPTYVWYIEMMKKYLFNLKDTEAFMTDKDKVSRKVIQEILEVDRYICTFHVAQAFKRHVNSSESLLSRTEKDV
uniref:ZSWIM1/3 RNaseH-like domain-containing protein n=1 Tax=Trichogramma kaykai TaxID=54128 RepID=A0ABD2W5X8_9HYME